MSMNMGEIYATLSLNSDKFNKNLEESKSKLDNVGTSSDKISPKLSKTEKSMDGVADSSKDANKQIGTLGSTTNNTSNRMDEFEEAVHSADDTEVSLNKNTKDSTEQIKKQGDQANDTKEMLSKMKGVLGAIGVTVGIGVLISKIKEIGDQAYQAKIKIKDMTTTINAMTGASGLTLSEYSDMATDIAANLGDDVSEVGTTLGKINTFFGVSGDELEDWTYEYQSLLDQLAKAGDSVSIDEINAVMKKWNISNEDNLKYLSMWYELTQNTGISMSNLMSALEEGDRSFGEIMGMTLDEASNFVANAYKGGDYGDAVSLASTMETLLAMQAEELGSTEEAQKYVDEMISAARNASDEQTAIQTLVNDFGLRAGLAKTLAGTIYSGTMVNGYELLSSDDERQSMLSYNQIYKTYEQKQSTAEQKIANNYDGVTIGELADRIYQESAEEGMNGIGALLSGININRISSESLELAMEDYLEPLYNAYGSYSDMYDAAVSAKSSGVNITINGTVYNPSQVINALEIYSQKLAQGAI